LDFNAHQAFACTSASTTLDAHQSFTSTIPTLVTRSHRARARRPETRHGRRVLLTPARCVCRRANAGGRRGGRVLGFQGQEEGRRVSSTVTDRLGFHEREEHKVVLLRTPNAKQFSSPSSTHHHSPRQGHPHALHANMPREQPQCVCVCVCVCVCLCVYVDLDAWMSVCLSVYIHVCIYV